LKKVLFFFRQQISLIKFLFDLPLLEHHNIRPFGLMLSMVNRSFDILLLMRGRNGRKVMKLAMATDNLLLLSHNKAFTFVFVRQSCSVPSKLGFV